MPSKTAARSRAKTSRSKAGSRQAATAPRKAPKKPTRPATRRSNPSVVAAAGAGVGRAARATWLMVARGVGGTARSVGRAHDIDPGHRRDGIALALLGVAVVIAASSWFDAARPVGAWIDGTLRTLIGSAVILLPIALAVDRRDVDAHRAQPGVAPTPDPRRGDDHPARPGTVAPLVGVAGHPGRPSARVRVHRLRHRRSAVGRSERVDRRAPAVHRRAVRCAAADRHHHPRGAGNPERDVRHPDVPSR